MIDSAAPDFQDLPGRRAVPPCYKPGAPPDAAIDVSIVTPYYNTPPLFLETYISVQSQSLQNWEWLIVDDGSPDIQAVERLADLARADSRIKVIRQPNGGTAAARNTGFAESKGRYIFLLDHDDMVEPTYLEKCVWFLDSNPQFSFCNSYTIVFGEQNFLWTTGYERGKAFLQANSGPPIAVVRRTAFEACGGFDARIRVLYEDWDFWLSMAKAGHWGHTIPEYLQWYRKLGSGRYEQILQSGYENSEFAREMQQKYPGLESNFPQPVRRHPEAFETLGLDSLAHNSLATDGSGRKVLFVLPWMVTGGADRVNLDLIEGLTAKGHYVTICATLVTHHQWEHQFSRFTPDIFVLPTILQPSDYPKFLAYILHSRAIDTVVISGSTIGYQILPLLRSVRPQAAFVDLCHVEETHWLNGGHPRFGAGYQDALDLNLTTTKHLAKWMESRGAESSRIRTFYTGVRPLKPTDSVAVRNRIRSEFQIDTNTSVVLFGGRICAQKRPDLLAEILRETRDRNGRFRALIVGDGELKVELDGLIQRYDLSGSVQMVGGVSHERWLEMLTAADILLMPSQYEGISVALLEALAAGVVPIVARVGGHQEIVSAKCGILIDHGDNEIQAYTSALLGLLNQPQEHQRLSSGCREVAATQLSWQGMVDNFDSFLSEAHALRISHPRTVLSPRLGLELATLALEYKRVNDALEWLWQERPKTAAGQADAVAQFAVQLSQTRLGQWLVNNKFIQTIGRKILNLLSRPVKP
jgi:glycosyltransferase involved in cell wall biosynthesis